MPDRRERKRRDSFTFDDTEVYNRVKKFYDDDVTDRSDDKDLRLQRYAKFRMWTEGRDWPIEDASDTGLPDIATHCLRLMDTLHNAVMSARPVITSKAHKKVDKDKQETVDQLIDYQIFEEQNGESLIGDLSEDFVLEGVFTCFIPWVKETREILDSQIFEPIPDDMEPIEYFSTLLSEEFRDAVPIGDGWDWRGDDVRIQFFTRDDGRVERIVRREVTVYDGPKLIAKSWEDVLHPVKVANLQIPSPSNPGGAPHVILRDYPGIDEIKRLAKNGTYDLTDKQKKELDAASESVRDDELDKQKDTMRGHQEPGKQEIVSHRTVTRLMCFDTFDINNDGVDEDVIWTVILELPDVVLRAKELTEVFPANPPRRPFGEASLLPVRGRRLGISLPELMEAMHDVMKQVIDQTMDAGTIKNAPNFFYRASSSVKAETIRMQPGEGYPLPNPQQDIFFPPVPNSDESWRINMLGLFNSMEERLTMEGDFNFGRVPPGSSEAMRTIGGMSMLANQGEARPERILRRFFMGLTEIWAQVHELNHAFLPEEKEIRITGLKTPGEEPYKEIAPEEVAGRFQFMFTANVMNSSRLALQQALTTYAAMLVSPISIQLGALQADGFERFLRDFG